MQIQKFNIAELIQSPSALTREQGKIVYNAIISLLSNGDKVVLDFSDIESIITPFLNVSIGKLYESYSSEQLQNLLELTNIPSGTSSKFQTVINNAKFYYKDKDNFNKVVKEVIDN